MTWNCSIPCRVGIPHIKGASNILKVGGGEPEGSSSHVNGGKMILCLHSNIAPFTLF